MLWGVLYTKNKLNYLSSPFLQEEDYPGAIQLCLECQKAASTFKHYSCIRQSINSLIEQYLVLSEGEQAWTSFTMVRRKVDLYRLKYDVNIISLSLMPTLLMQRKLGNLSPLHHDPVSSLKYSLKNVKCFFFYVFLSRLDFNSLIKGLFIVSCFTHCH